MESLKNVLLIVLVYLEKKFKEKTRQCSPYLSNITRIMRSVPSLSPCLSENIHTKNDLVKRLNKQIKILLTDNIFDIS